jgi:predicted O-methyltransferase YrrM
MSRRNGILRTLPVLSLMESIPGWLEADEADLLLAACASGLRDCRDACALVEIGSYCGRSTVVLASAVQALRPDARVYAIDPHTGVVGALDQTVSSGPSTLEVFQRNLAAAALTDSVVVVQEFSTDVAWDQPIAFLFIDGLHDYASVSADFAHFGPYLVVGGMVAFHDYADYYPGVVQLVDEVLSSGGYSRAGCVRSMVVLEKTGT